MNVGFEAKRLFTNNTGLGNYNRFVVEALSNYFPGTNYFVYTPRLDIHPDAKRIIDRPNVRIITPPASYQFLRSTSIWRTWGISKEPLTKSLQVFHGLSQELPLGLPKGLLKIVTVHDLIFFRYPQFYNPVDVAIYKSKLKHACRKADKIVAISRQTGEDLMNFLSVDESRIEIIYQGCHPNFKVRHSNEAINQIKTKYRLPQEYILNVGTVEKRKNVMLLIKALALIPKQSRIPLVVMGKQTEYYRMVIAKAEALDVRDDIHFIQGVSFEDFPKIYQGASLFVYPSLFEGFGIPLIEAIESGVPVITSSGSCFREAAGPASIFVDPGDDRELAFQITSVLGSQEARTRMITASRAYAMQFNPDVIAGKLDALYKG